MDIILSALQWLADFFGGVTSNLVDLLQSFWVWAIGKLFILWIDAKIWALTTAWSIAQSYLDSIELVDHINQGLSVLPQGMRDMISAMRIPVAINNIIHALVARLVLRFIPGA